MEEIFEVEKLSMPSADLAKTMGKMAWLIKTRQTSRVQMANHGFVNTRKSMSPDGIDAILESLNGKLFKNHLRFERVDGSNDGSSDYDSLWRVLYDGPESKYWKKDQFIRMFWLNDNHSFEIRHGGGGNWEWWIDHAITNEVALHYDGDISDTGLGPDEIWQGAQDKYNTFQDHQKIMYDHVQDNLKRRWLMQEDQEMTPRAFHIDLGPRIKLEEIYG